MCLLITGASAQIKRILFDTPGLLESIYHHNADGLGAMWVADGKVHTPKILPRFLKDVEDFLEGLPPSDTEVALHFRWRTHGDISLKNVHPYKVSETCYLAHNGVLHTGNSKDKARSDTCHFIENYMSLPSATLYHEGYQEMLSEFIGPDNRLAILSVEYGLTVVNKDSGVELEGLWFSNVYAWDSSILNSVNPLSAWDSELEVMALSDDLQESPQEELIRFFAKHPNPYSEGNPFSRAINRKDVQSLCTLLLESDEDPCKLAEALLDSI